MLFFKGPSLLLATVVMLVGSMAFADSGATITSSPQVAYPDDGIFEADACSYAESCCEIDACGACDSCGCNSGGCNSSCGYFRRCCCPLGDPWTLFGRSCCGIEIGGWVSAGIYANAHGAADNGPLGFNNVGDGFTANQLWIYSEKVADTGGCGTDWGYRIDYVFGVDGPDTQAFGAPNWDNDWDSGRDYGSALPQLYGEVAVNNLSVKFGHFYTIIGWEVAPAPDNFFYTHAYAMYYAEPFTHTGVLATYQVSNALTAYGGWTQGWDTGFDDTNRGSTFLGGLSYAISDRATATWAVSAGDFGIGAGDIYMHSFVLDLALTDRLTYVFQHDLGINTGLGAADSEWYGINQYLQYEICERLAIGGRFEWFRDDDGARISYNGTAVGDYYALTAGLNWRPHANVCVRPEIRWDRFEGTAAAGELPFEDGASDDQFSGGFDVVFTY